MTLIARKYDVAERDARNRALGRAGEERVLAPERANFLAAGRTDLAERIRWVSHVDGDVAGYDILSFGTDGRDRADRGEDDQWLGAHALSHHAQ